MFDINVSVNEESHYFTTKRKNHSATVTSAQVLLGCDTLKFQHNTITRMKC